MVHRSFRPTIRRRFFDTRIAADIEQGKRRRDILLQVAHHIEIGGLRRRRMDKVKDNLMRLDGGRQRHGVRELAVIPFDVVECVHELATAAERTDPKA